MSRDKLGWNVSRYHNKELVLEALLDAMKRTGRQPQYLHSDQGSEYDSQDYVVYAKGQGIKISMSRKGHPWENGFQESFYSGFKLDLGVVSRFEEVGELIENIHQTLYYYNHKRIHTSLKMTPVQFRRLYEERFRQIV